MVLNNDKFRWESVHCNNNEDPIQVQQQPYVSSNFYYGFVNNHQNNTNDPDNDNLTKMEIEQNISPLDKRKRCFEYQNPQENTKRCRFSNDMQMSDSMDVLVAPADVKIDEYTADDINIGNNFVNTTTTSNENVLNLLQQEQQQKQQHLYQQSSPPSLQLPPYTSSDQLMFSTTESSVLQQQPQQQQLSLTTATVTTNSSSRIQGNAVELMCQQQKEPTKHVKQNKIIGNDEQQRLSSNQTSIDDRESIELLFWQTHGSLLHYENYDESFI